MHVKNDPVPLKTPDLRYVVVRDRLWRASNPELSDAIRQRLVERLMDARRAIRDGNRAEDADAVAAARRQVDLAKRELGERGPPWWRDGSADYHRHLIKNTPYADWYRSLGPDEQEGALPDG